MRNWMFAGAFAATIAFAAPASATAFFTFTSSGNVSTTGTDANFVKTNALDGAITVNVRVTAWSVDASGVVRDSYIAAYGNGLGVTSGDENGNNNTHVVDNDKSGSDDRTDFLLFQFDRAVSLVSGKFTAFSVNGQSADTDATIAYGTTAIPYTTQLALDGKASSTALTPLFANSLTSLGDGNGGTRNLAPANWIGNLWLVSADFSNKDGKVDGFKFSNATFATVAVPEPSTWAMMIAGFGILGAGLRRRSAKRSALTA